MTQHRYSAEQIIRGIEFFFSDYGDLDVSLDPDASVYAYVEQATEADGECPLYFLCALGEYFGLEWGEERYIAWLKLPRSGAQQCCSREDHVGMKAKEEWEEQVAPTLTVRRFAEYLARKVPGTSFAPRTIFGRPCAEAGVFLGLASCPEVGGRRIAPSTPLTNALSESRLEGLWKRAEWISGQRLPQLPGHDDLFCFSPPAVGLANAVFWAVLLPLLLVFLGLLATTLANVGWDWWFVGLVLGGLSLALTCYIAHSARWACLMRTTPVTPEGVVTFGDLAQAIVAGQAKARC